MKDLDNDYEPASFGAGNARVGRPAVHRKAAAGALPEVQRTKKVSGGMKTHHLPRIDLNLLFVFEAMMQERSVTRAAQRLCVSQSSVSHALNRLRSTLKDELFIRGTGEMRPTPRAIALAVSVTPTLMHIRAALSPSEFDPGTAVHTFQIAMTDYAATLLLEKLTKVVRARAPGVNLKISLNVMKDVWSLLDKQEIDFMVGMIPTPPDRFASDLLYEDDIAVVMSRQNPFAKRKLSVEDYAAAKHVYIPVDGVMPVHTGRIDRALELKGLVRRHVLTVSQFALAPTIIQQTDYIMTIPKRIAEMCRTRYKLRVVESPVALPLQPTRIIWHPQLGNHSANRWMMQILREVSAKF
jgi:DNA-binding transcriptional LysR family regulator